MAERETDEQVTRDRIDHELIELLNELRVVLPGVQVLFGFLLVVPFQSRFATVAPIAQDVYFAGMLAAAISIVLLIAPATYHRLNMRAPTPEKEEMLFTSSRLTLVGTGFLGVAIMCSLFVVGDILFGGAVALTVSTAAGALIVGLWYAIPIFRRRTGTGERVTHQDDHERSDR